MPVLDASVVIEYLIGGQHHHAAREHVLRGDLRAPHLVDAEVGHALRRIVFRGDRLPEEGAAALSALRQRRAG